MQHSVSKQGCSWICTTPPPQVLESKRLAKCLLNFIASHPSEAPALLALFSIFTSKTHVDFGFLSDFCRETVAAKFSGAEKRALLAGFLASFRSGAISQVQAVHTLQVLVIPMLTAAFTSGQEDALDAELAASIATDLLDPVDGRASSYSESLRRAPAGASAVVATCWVLLFA